MFRICIVCIFSSFSREILRVLELSSSEGLKFATIDIEYCSINTKVLLLSFHVDLFTYLRICCPRWHIHKLLS